MQVIPDLELNIHQSVIQVLLVDSSGVIFVPGLSIYKGLGLGLASSRPASCFTSGMLTIISSDKTKRVVSAVSIRASATHPTCLHTTTTF